MAALSEHVAVCQSTHENEVISVSKADTEDCIIVSYRTQTISVHKVLDQKTVSSWSVRRGLKVTSPTVWCSKTQEYITVLNNQEVRRWSKDNTDLEKSRKKQCKIPIIKAFSFPDLGPVVLCKNGVVDFLANIKDVSESGPLGDGDEILFTGSCTLSDTHCIACVVSNKEKTFLRSYWYKGTESWSSRAAEVDVRSIDLCTCCLQRGTSGDTVNVYYLCSSGDLFCSQLSEHNTRSVEHKLTIACVHSSVSMETVDETHIAIAGIQKDGEDGLGIYDIKFDALQAWKPLPEKSQSKYLLFCEAGHLFVSCGKTLYSNKYDCQPSALTALISQQKAHPSSQQQLPSNLKWNAGRRRSLSPTKTDDTKIAAIFTKLINPEQTGSLQKFRSAFTELANILKKNTYNHWLSSSHMTQIVTRCITEKKFWPQDELHQLIKLQCIPSSLIMDVFETLMQHDESVLIHTALTSIRDIPEKCVCRCLTFFLQQDDSKLGKAVTEVCNEALQDVMDGPLSAQKALFVNQILSQPYNDAFLVECLQDVTFKHALLLLEYLCFVLEKQSIGDLSADMSSATDGPNLLKVVDWLCLLLDAHMTQLVISPDAHVVLIRLHGVVESQVRFYDELVNLEALLQNLKERSSLPTKKNIGHYCIEVLYVH